MWQRPRTWIVLSLVAAAAVLGSTRYFPNAFPLISVELEMDRPGALSAAESLAESRGWPTAGYRQAASFGQQDDALKRYLELEAGGPEAWTRLLESGGHVPYRWQVRQFREGEATESEVWFGPDGAPWGYTITLPEDAPGATLETDAARRLAESAAADWGVELAPYALVETGGEVRPSGRMDHWFVYERSDLEYGDARFRLRLAVAGDRSVEVLPYAEVPEAFDRRYAEMRSANDLIALMASLSSGLLYVVLGAGVGLVLLMRRRWVLWRRPLLWGGIIGGLMTVAALNELPLQWIGYDTAVPASGFLTEQVVMAVVTGLVMMLYVALMLMAGESLARRAFPRHVQLWKSWSKGVANSRTMLGLTVGGYVFAALFMAGAVLFYMFANGVLGWPVSGESLLHPDMLATPFPWVSAVAISLMAGFSEEAMFRAIPLACAALLGARYGRRGLWIGGVLVLQAVIFAAAHANYPQQPSYARVVELFLPSIALGLVFLRFGFMPAVIGHFAYDMVWFSIPVFASSAAGTWLNQTMVLALGAIPLGVVLVARYRWGATETLPAGVRNGDWTPSHATAEPSASPVPAEPGGTPVPGVVGTAGAADGSRPVSGPTPDRLPGLVPRVARWAPALGLAGLALWAMTATFSPLSAPLELGPGQAAEAAREALEERSLLSPEDGEWRVLPRVHATRTDEHRFVWETAGETVFPALLGGYLKDAHWDVRAARFEGELDVRAEEFLVEVSPSGDVYRIRQTLPEERPGEALEEQAAAGLALAEAQERWLLAPDSLEPVSAEANQRPARRDWTFTYAMPTVTELPEGQARVRVRIAGAGVTDATRLIHIPEQWQREQRARETRDFILGSVTGLLVMLLGATAVVLAVRRFSGGRLPTRVALVAGSAAAALMAASMLNGWPARVAGMSTSQPFGNQVASAVGGSAFLLLLMTLVAALATGLAHAWAEDLGGSGRRDRRAALRLGVPLGLLAAGVLTAVASLASSGPPWGSYGGADALAPFMAALLEPVVGLFVTAVCMLLALGGLLHAPRRARRLPVRALLAIAIALVLGGSGTSGDLMPWMIGSAVVLGLLYLGMALVRTHGMALVPPVAAGVVLLGAIPVLVHGPFPGARPGLIVGLVMVAGVAAAWAGWLPYGATAPVTSPMEAPGREPAREPAPAGGAEGRI